MRRALLDMASQLTPLATNLLDRVVLTALIVRVWGVPAFEHWSLLLATVTMLSIADLGSQISFSNRMAEAAHGGSHEEATRVFAESNAIFLAIASVILAATLLLALFSPLQHLVGLPAPLQARDQLTIGALGFAIAGRMAVSNQIGVYRANSAFARGTLVTAGIDLLRVLLVVAAVALGLGLAEAAVATALSVLMGNFILIPLDIARKFPRFRFRLARPTPFTTRGQLRLGLLYSVSFVPSVVMVQLPVILIGSAASASTGALASYVLLRTISNFLRTLIQKFTFVLGMELARLKAQSRDALLERTYSLTIRGVACIFGFSSGVLIGFGPELMRMWVGKAELFDPLLLSLMLLPLVLTPTAQIASPFLSYTNRPGPVAAAVLAQLATAILVAVALPIEDVALKLTIAVFVTEVVPLAPIVIAAARRRWSFAVVRDEAVATALAVVCLGVSYGASSAVRPHLHSTPALIATGIAMAAVFGGLMFAFFAKPVRRWRASQ
jgi:O-antigen/teichoic acid export membrane protein